MLSAMRCGTLAEELRSQGNDLTAALTEQVAVRAERLGRYLRETDGRQILDDVQGFAREQPWLVAALGLAAGVALARLLKASARMRSGQGPGPAPQEHRDRLTVVPDTTQPPWVRRQPAIRTLRVSVRRLRLPRWSNSLPAAASSRRRDSVRARRATVMSGPTEAPMDPLDPAPARDH